jgi:PST family polysaccharide transporter
MSTGGDVGRESTAGHDEHAVIHRASAALAWGLFNAAAARLGTLAIGIALARVLGPQEFGTYAVALLALMAALSFNELGVSLAIVRWAGDPRAIAPTVATLSVGASVAIAAAGVLLAPALAAALGDTAATPVIQVLFLTVIVSGMVATPAALLQREFRQRVRTLIDQVTIWVGALVSIALAVAGMGAMSLAVGRLVGVAISCLLFVRAEPQGFRLGWATVHVKPLLRFGLPLAGASIVVFAVAYVDQVVTSRILGTAALGFYVMAANLSSWPVTVFSAPLRGVAPAAFARLQHDPLAMSTTFNSVAGVVASVTLPVCLVLAGAAEPLVGLVYGDAWVPAAEPLRWLAVMACFRILFELAYDYVVVTGGSRQLLLLQLVWLAALVPSLIAGAQWGTAGVAATQTVVAAFVMAPLYALVLRRAGVPVAPLVRRLAVPAVAAVGVGAAALALGATVASRLVAVGSSLFLGGLLICLLVWCDRQAVRALRTMRSADEPARQVPA